MCCYNKRESEVLLCRGSNLSDLSGINVDHCVVALSKANELPRIRVFIVDEHVAVLTELNAIAARATSTEEALVLVVGSDVGGSRSTEGRIAELDLSHNGRGQQPVERTREEETSEAKVIALQVVEQRLAVGERGLADLGNRSATNGQVGNHTSVWNSSSALNNNEVADRSGEVLVDDVAGSGREADEVESRGVAARRLSILAEAVQVKDVLVEGAHHALIAVTSGVSNN